MATREEWSEALWKFYFSESEHPRPIYLSMDDEDLVSMGINLLGTDDLSEIKGDLVDVVASDTQLDLAFRLVFTRTVSAAKVWFSDNRGRSSLNVSPPPHLPLLAVTVLAAREIGGDAINSIGFYTNLRKLLGVREEFQEKLQNAYTSVIEDLWGRLNTILIELRYTRGIPTATSITHRYVSIPISQSIVRRRDRRKLAEFFLDSDLSPDSFVGIVELQQLFEWWLSRGGHSISANLEALWRRGKTERERVLEVIAQELQAWDGSPPHSFDGLVMATQLRVLMVRDVDWFGNISLKVGLVHPGPSDPNVNQINFGPIGTSDDVQSSRINTSNFFSLSMPDSFSGSKILFRDIELEAEGFGKVRKAANSIHVLRFKHELQCFVEDGRPNLGESVLILAASALGIGEKVRLALSEYADEGLSELSEKIHGLQGWRVFQDVKFVFPFSNTSELAPLSTNSNASLGFIDGLKMVEEPGIRVWSRHWLPTVDAAVPEGSVINLRILSAIDAEARRTFREKTGFGRVQIDLRKEPLSDGEYIVELSLSGATERVVTKKLSIRSETSPRVWEVHPNEILGYLNNSPSTPKWGLERDFWCGFPNDPGPYASRDADFELPSNPSWIIVPKVLHRAEANQISEALSKDNCSFSGAHSWDLGTCVGEQRYVDAVCTKCRAQRREACKPHLALKPEELMLRNIRPLGRAVPIEVQETQTLSSSSNFQIMALHKSLRFLRKGTYREIKEAAASIGLDALQTRKLVRWLEVSGSLEIESHHEEDASWCLNKAAFVEVRDSEYRLVGNFGPETITELKNHLSPNQINQSISPYGIHVSINGVQSIENISKSTGISHILRPLAKMSRWVGPLSDWLKDRELEQTPDGVRLEKFNFENASWQEIETGRIGTDGAYRVKGLFSTSTYYVPAFGVERNLGYRMDAVGAKYLDCFFKSNPLLSYNPEMQELHVPLGMELPGLLGRLAVAASGKPPVEIRRKIESQRVSVIRYENIDKDTASIIYSCLGGK